jgi:DNA-binding PadR family transcriptional regulator
MQAVDRLSSGRVQLRAGTLYAALDRLTTDGLIAVDHEEAVDGRLRRYYALTPQGTAALEAEVARMRSNVALATAHLSQGTATMVVNHV